MPLYFLAIAPPEPLLSRIEAFRTRWGNPHHQVEPHITVQIPFRWHGPTAPFLGAAGQAAAMVTPFALQLGAPARFGGGRVLFLTAAGSGLTHLHHAVVGALAELLPAADRGRDPSPYAPHLTLASGRFGISDADMSAMERAAAQELAGLPPFRVSSLRCYRKGEGPGRWERFRDLPLHLV